MSGPHPGPCIACGGPANSYALMCCLCDQIDDEHFLTPDGYVLRLDGRGDLDHENRLKYKQAKRTADREERRVRRAAAASGA